MTSSAMRFGFRWAEHFDESPFSFRRQHIEAYSVVVALAAIEKRPAWDRGGKAR